MLHSSIHWYTQAAFTVCYSLVGFVRYTCQGQSSSASLRQLLLRAPYCWHILVSHTHACSQMKLGAAAAGLEDLNEMRISKFEFALLINKIMEVGTSFLWITFMSHS